MAPDSRFGVVPSSLSLASRSAASQELSKPTRATKSYSSSRIKSLQASKASKDSAEIPRLSSTASFSSGSDSEPDPHSVSAKPTPKPLTSTAAQTRLSTLSLTISASSSSDEGDNSARSNSPSASRAQAKRLKRPGADFLRHQPIHDRDDSSASEAGLILQSDMMRSSTVQSYECFLAQSSQGSHQDDSTRVAGPSRPRPATRSRGIGRLRIPSGVPPERLSSPTPSLSTDQSDMDIEANTLGPDQALLLKQVALTLGWQKEQSDPAAVLDKLLDRSKERHDDKAALTRFDSRKVMPHSATGLETCPFCHEPLPAQPSKRLVRMMQNWLDRYHQGEQVMATDTSSICIKHQDERTVIPEGRARGWPDPSQLDWNQTIRRITKPNGNIWQIIVSRVTNPESSLWFQRICKRHAQTRKRETALTIEDVEDQKAGYYGDLGQELFMAVFSKVFLLDPPRPDLDLKRDSAVKKYLPLDVRSFISRCIIPEVVCLLIQQDLQDKLTLNPGRGEEVSSVMVSLEDANAERLQSNRYGSAVFSNEGGDPQVPSPARKSAHGKRRRRSDSTRPSVCDILSGKLALAASEKKSDAHSCDTPRAKSYRNC